MPGGCVGRWWREKRKSGKHTVEAEGWVGPGVTTVVGVGGPVDVVGGVARRVRAIGGVGAERQPGSSGAWAAGQMCRLALTIRSLVHQTRAVARVRLFSALHIVGGWEQRAPHHRDSHNRRRDIRVSAFPNPPKCLLWGGGGSDSRALAATAPDGVAAGCPRAKSLLNACCGGVRASSAARMRRTHKAGPSHWIDVGRSVIPNRSSISQVGLLSGREQRTLGALDHSGAWNWRGPIFCDRDWEF